MQIGIVGEGMAGLACAEGLAAQGHDVVLLDKGRGPGGRMSTRRMRTAAGDAFFDHGAQYFTVRDEAFRRRVDAWLAQGTVAAWPPAGSEAYVGVPGMSAPVRDMAQGQAVRWSTLVTRLESPGHGWRLLLDRGEAVDVAQNCWRGDDIIGWAARNNAKPGRIGPESWVVQAGPAWSRANIEADPDWVAATLEGALSQLLGAALPPSVARSSHRWRFARSGAEGAGAIFDHDRRLGLCGDWLIGPRVEAAWLSGTALAAQIGTAPR
jgi:hypothetical protein